MTPRYYKLNLHALFRHGTVEFRHPPAATDPHTVVGYVLLYLKLVQYSRQHDVQALQGPGLDYTGECARALRECEAAVKGVLQRAGSASNVVQTGDAAQLERVTDALAKLESLARTFHKSGDFFTNSAARNINVWSPEFTKAYQLPLAAVDVVSPWSLHTLVSVQQQLKHQATDFEGGSLAHGVGDAVAALMRFHSFKTQAQGVGAPAWVQQDALSQLRGTYGGQLLQKVLSTEVRQGLAPLVLWLQAACEKEEAEVMVGWVVERALWCAGEGKHMAPGAPRLPPGFDTLARSLRQELLQIAQQQQRQGQQQGGAAA